MGCKQVKSFFSWQENCNTITSVLRGLFTFIFFQSVPTKGHFHIWSMVSAGVLQLKLGDNRQLTISCSGSFSQGMKLIMRSKSDMCYALHDYSQSLNLRIHVACYCNGSFPERLETTVANQFMFSS